MIIMIKELWQKVLSLPWGQINFSEWLQICIGSLSLFATVYISVLIYKLQVKNDRRNRKETLEEKARNFLIEHEQEREYLPWCIIASGLYRIRPHSRKIYAAFCQLPDSLQCEILRMAGLDELVSFDQQDIHNWLECLKADIENYHLGKDILYDNSKYFFRAYNRYYSSIISEDFYEGKYKPIKEKDNVRVLIRNNGLLSLSEYIDEYFYYYINGNDNGEIIEAPVPPVDYMCDVVDFAFGEESTICLWVMELIKDICILINNLENTELKEGKNPFPYAEAEPIYYEDMFYLTLQWLSFAYGKREI